MRPTHFSEGNFAVTSAARPVDETAISPRFGATVTVPRLNWTFRAFYGHYYQAPPIETVSGPALINYVQGQQARIHHAPRRARRRTSVRRDHSLPRMGARRRQLPNQRRRIFSTTTTSARPASSFPITISQAVIRGWELTLRSPRFAHRGQMHLAYSNQIAEGAAPSPAASPISRSRPDSVPLDHDQRNTLNVGGDVTLPWRAYASTNVYYGSGFQQRLSRPALSRRLSAAAHHLRSLARQRFRRALLRVANALNVANRRVEYDNSLTFGGFHWNNPREIYVELRYRFHY